MDVADQDETYDEAQPARYFGKYPGVVIQNGPPDGGKHLGQVKVRVPGILEETADGKGNQPLEVIASPSFVPGFFFVPEKDDPVWVEFAAGDINFPIWTGVWYPKNKGAPQTFDGKDPTEKQKVIHTAAGHVVHLDDDTSGTGTAKIVIKDGKGGNTVTLHEDETEIKSKGATINLGKDSLTITCGSGTITFSNQDLTIKYGQSNSIKLSDQGIEIQTAPPSVTVNGSPVVLSALLNWLLAHQHVGNMGAPTPLMPAPPLPTSPPFLSKAG